MEFKCEEDIYETKGGGEWFVIDDEDPIIIEQEVDNDPIVIDDDDSVAKQSKIKRFLKLSHFDEEKGSRVVSVQEFEGDYSDLKFGNGGDWARMDSSFAKHYQYVTRNNKGVLRFSWDATTSEREMVTIDFSGLPVSKRNSISHIKVYRRKDPSKESRSIHREIRDALRGSSCVACGSAHDVEIDHKNGLYNDSRVLSLETQKLEDFQTLCRHCNLQKRQTLVETRRTGKRYGATRIPMLLPWGIDFTQGDENYEETDVNAMVGTYWYDPVAFMIAVISKNES